MQASQGLIPGGEKLRPDWTFKKLWVGTYLDGGFRV